MPKKNRNMEVIIDELATSSIKDSETPGKLKPNLRYDLMPPNVKTPEAGTFEPSLTKDAETAFNFSGRSRQMVDPGSLENRLTPMGSNDLD